MPWEGSELWVADFADGALSGERLVAGGAAEAIVQPEWSPDGVLHFSSDRTGWWNLYRGDYEPVTALEAEIGGPLWVFGQSWYAFLPDGRIVCAVFSDGSDRLAVVERRGLRYVPLEFTRIVDLTTDGERALFIGASPTRSPSIVAADLATGALEVLSEDGEEVVDAAYVSIPRPLEYPTTGEKIRPRALLSAA
jgi:CubicO group peptidase (beta-lactamase class C family)